MTDKELAALQARLSRRNNNDCIAAAIAIRQLIQTREALLPFARLANSWEGAHAISVKEFKKVDGRDLPPLEDSKLISTSLGACRKARDMLGNDQ